ncbi:ABC transporter substrate-binding protein [Prevotella salivae]|uniref:ABC transporter substrate-binding protein n=1 Tax=Segatella salivae TaxID=228604 RepID=A0AAW4NU41_9BACT|nr:ABC transporter substrate-binding protein [Segatella salivae]MBW4866762.1 ABC transporter substrate-binding protein [Segatella salivae]MBW4910699.1 ABC transporter substrate-binding protein [Segatella salivae]
MRKDLFAFLIIIIGVFTSCNHSQTRLEARGGDTVRFEYARHLKIVKYQGYSIATLTDPWKQGKILHTYALVPKGKAGDEVCKAFSSDNNQEVTIVRTPITRSVVFTTVHCALLYDLKAESAIKGVCDLQYISIPDVQQRAKLPVSDAHHVVDCGNSMSSNVEKIIDLKPEAIMVSPFENSGGYGKLDKLHIPLIEMADYMEESSLGRAEWMKFYGMLFGREKAADSLFNEVKSNYEQLKQKAQTAKQTRSVFTERMMGNVWYVPGGRSVIGGLLQDARARYVFANDTHSGSVALSFESVLDRAGKADIWLFKYNEHPSTLQELLKENAGYGEFKAVKTHQVFACDCTHRPYYEEVSFHPDRLLSDVIQIVHPDIAGFAPMHYYQRLK